MFGHYLFSQLVYKYKHRRTNKENHKLYDIGLVEKFVYQNVPLKNKQTYHNVCLQSIIYFI